MYPVLKIMHMLNFLDTFSVSVTTPYYIVLYLWIYGIKVEESIIKSQTTIQTKQKNIYINENCKRVNNVLPHVI